MALSMSRPWKHPKTGVYWLRKRIPDDLRSLLGKREEKRSLKTRDPVEAKRRHLEALTQVEAQWANLKAGPKSLTEREAHALAAPIYHQWIEQHRDNPSQQTFWQTDMGTKLWPPPELVWDGTRLKFSDKEPFRDTYWRSQMQGWCEELARECLAKNGLIVDDESQLKLAKAIGAAVQQASLVLTRFAQGDFRSIEGEGRVDPALPTRTWSNHIAEPLPFEKVIQGWATERRPAEKTRYEWARVIRQLATFIGHDNVKRLTADDVIAWKQSMVAAGLSAKTVRDAKLAPVRSILGWATDNRLIGANPAERITIEVKTKAAESKRGFSDDEAVLVLKAALSAKDTVRRWVPWLCAYSGARLSEVCQLRQEDIVQSEGIWVMKIDPDAGSVKTRSSERVVPLHPALIENGFLAFAQRAKPGPLFTDLPPDKFGSRGGNGTKVLGRWVRSLDLNDPRLSPNHSWRHRFKTLGRRHALAPDIVSAIVGHARKTVADSYGEFPISALHREICKIPTLHISGNEGRVR